MGLFKKNGDDADDGKELQQRIATNIKFLGMMRWGDEFLMELAKIDEPAILEGKPKAPKTRNGMWQAERRVRHA